MKYVLGLFLIIISLLLIFPQNVQAGCTIKFPCFPEKECCGCNCPDTSPEPTATPNPQATPTTTPTPILSPTVTPTLSATPTPTPQGGGGGNGGGGTGGPPGVPNCESLVPGTTRLISAVLNNSGGVDLKWTLAGLATHYSISYGLESGKYLYGIADTGKVDSYTISGLNLNQNYCFAVLPINYCQPSSYSNEICTLPGGSGGVVLGSQFSGGGEVLGLSFTGSYDHYFYYAFLAALSLFGIKLVKDNA